MDKLFNFLSVCIGVAGGVCVYLFGGLDVLFKTLVVLTVLDYASGVLNAAIQKRLSSEVGFDGIVKKVMLYIVVAASVVVDRMLGGDVPLREIVITFFAANEGLSVLENVSGYLPIPEKLKSTLIQLRDENGGDSNNGD
jgi:toxin secretion/phage lysis holin